MSKVNKNNIDTSIYDKLCWIGKIDQLREHNLFIEKEPIMIRTTKDNKKLFHYITENNEWIDDKKLKSDIIYGRNKKYVIVECFKCGYKLDCDIHDNNNECIQEYIKFSKEIKKITKGLINFFITGSTTIAALKLFYALLGEENYNTFEEVDEEEYKWLEYASMGGLIHCNKNYEGEGHEYDVNSHYPVIQSGRDYIPIKKGRYEKLTELPNNLDNGIYRCKITGDINKYLFRENFDNYYTHKDIINARNLGYTVELINDSFNNALIYDKDKMMTGTKLFYKYVKYLFNLKEIYNKNDYYTYNLIFKKILNCLWGKLSESNITTIKVKIGEDINLKSGEDIISIDFDGIYTILTISKGNKYYKGDLPRIKPFLTSYGRFYISKKLYPYIDKCVRIHTDGFILNEKCDDLTILKGNEQIFKGMKYKNLGQIKIIHVNEIKTI